MMRDVEQLKESITTLVVILEIDVLTKTKKPDGIIHSG
jgi:hypothetical protein